MNFFEEADWWFYQKHKPCFAVMEPSLPWLMVSTCCPPIATSTGSGGHSEQLAKEMRDATLSLGFSKELKENKWELNFP